MDSQEKKKLLTEFNDSAFAYDKTRMIHQIFKDQARATPDRIALVDDTRTMTFSELDRRSDILAAKIMSRGIGPDQPVGVNLERGIEFTIAILAALKSGGCYVPLDPHFPPNRLDFIVEAISCASVITSSGSELANINLSGIFIDQIDWRQESVPDDYRMAGGDGHDLAYILFTSGSTGEPKGVEIEHCNLLNLYHWEKLRFPHEGHYNASQAASICFDASVREFWSYLPDGATLYFIPREVILNPKELVNWICDNKIVDCYLPTPATIGIMDLPWPEKCSLKYFYIGGERFTRFPPSTFPCPIINLYGPAECTVDSTHAVYNPGENDGLGFPPIGRPVGNARIYILDEEMEPVPVGEQGELYIGGDLVGRGYAGRPDLTEKAYIRDPGHDITDPVIYKTGDLAKWRPDGNIDFIGRNDFQVKIRGFRIELSEIEAVLNKHKDVTRSAVKVFDEGDDRKYIAAYVELKRENSTITAALYDQCTRELPDYMVPTTLQVLDALPLTHNGKTDYKNLPKPQLGSGNDPGDMILSKSQRIVMDVWQELLHVTPGLEDNFFDLGGHSLMAMQFCSRVEAKTGVSLPINTIFEFPNLSSLAALISVMSGNAESMIPFVKLPRDRDLFPASGMQDATWRQHQFDSSSIGMNIPLEVSLNGKVDENILKKALAGVVVNHEMLRSSFEHDGRNLFIRIHPPSVPELNMVDLSEMSPADIESSLNLWRRQQGKIKFSLEKYPLWQARLIKLSENEFKLFINLHHIIHDGWSSGILFSELTRNYEAYALGNEPPVSDECDYVDYAHWLKMVLESGVREKQFDFWRKQLTELPPPLKLSFQHDLEKHQISHEGARCNFLIEPELTRKMKILAEQNDVTLFILLQAIYQTLLFKYSGQTDLLTGAVSANRRHPLTEKIMGEFINSVTLRSDFSGDPVFASLLKKMKKTCLEALDNQDLPFVEINRELSMLYGRHDAAFQYSLMLQNFPWHQKEFAGIKMKYREIGNGSAKLNILATFMEDNGGLEAFFEYNKSLYDTVGMETFVKEFVILCDAVCRNCNAKISDLTGRTRDESSNARCVVIGDTGMALLCTEKLLRRGFKVLAVVSSDPEMQKYSREHNLPFYDLDQTNISETLEQYEFDYLFSIINGKIIRQNVLDMPRKFAINYHDAPLPRYAGMYATSWALINQEKIHAVSWHVMTAEVDAGDILVQKKVVIKPEDNVDLLDAKCFQAAIEGFDELLQKLILGQANPLPQDLSRRTLFGLYQRPEHGIVIDWTKPGSDIIALVKACAFRRVDNPFGVVKLLLDDNKFLIVRNAGVAGTDTVGREPGKIISIDNREITVATGDGTIKITEACLPDGSAPTFNDLGLKPEMQLPLIDEGTAAELDNFYHDIIRNEYKIVKQLKTSTAPDLPVYVESSGDSTGKIEIDPGSCFSAIFGASTQVNAAAFALYIAWLCRSQQTNLALKAPVHDEHFPALLANTVPWLLELDLHQPFRECLQETIKSCENALLKGRFLKDAWMRYKCVAALNNSDFIIAISSKTVYLQTRAGFDPGELLAGFACFCRNAALVPDSPLTQLGNICPREYLRQIMEWNETAVDFDLNEPYITKFKRTAARLPEKKAVSCNDRSLTYAELDQLSCSLANYMLARGVIPGQFIALRGEHSLHTAVALLAILKAGCAYLPLDANYPRQRIEYMINDSGVRFFCWDDRAGLRCDFEAPGVQVFDLATVIPELETSSVIEPDITLSPDDIAYLMYTSGTTGAPKGVMISQRNLVNHNLAVIQEFELSNQTKTLQFASLNFDISVEEIFPTWLAGGELIFIKEGLMENPPELCRFIAEHKITFLDLPTAYWHELVNLIDELPMPDSVKTVVIGGEKASVEHYKRWQEHTQNIRLLNTYGPTECTIIATISDDLSCIGRPLPNYRTYVVDKFLRPVPIGCSGELLIGGAGVGPGYLNRPDLTAEKFVSSPFVKNDILYHTGDRVKYLSDGNIEFIGRVDTQIKLRGFRIEPGGIENLINQYPGITMSRVLVYNDNLTAYFTVKPGISLALDELKTYLADRLPTYMVPAFLIQIDVFPTTPNGKIDTKQLPPPGSQAIKGSQTSRQSDNAMTKTICDIYAKLLMIDHVSPDDGFFEVGGDSLKAIRLVMEIEKSFGYKLRMEQLYSTSTPTELASYISGNSSTIANGSEDTEEKPAANVLTIDGWSAVVPLKTTGSRPPLFVMHTTPGDIMGYANLVSHMDSEQPVYGLQAVGLKNISLAQKTVQDMAAFYVERVKEVQPEGPYMLAGWCFGGFLAYEMACQLHEAGEKVGFLGMIETWGQPQRGWRFKLHRLKNLFHWGPSGWMEFFSRRLKKRIKQDRNLQQLDFIGELAGDSASAAEIETMKRLYRINFTAGWNYYMKPYPGKVHVFMAEIIIDGIIPDPHWNWGGLAQIESHIFPCDHASILKPPNVDKMAEIFCREIERNIT